MTVWVYCWNYVSVVSIWTIFNIIYVFSSIVTTIFPVWGWHKATMYWKKYTGIQYLWLNHRWVIYFLVTLLKGGGWLMTIFNIIYVFSSIVTTIFPVWGWHKATMYWKKYTGIQYLWLNHRWVIYFLVTLLKGGGWLMRALFVRRLRRRPHPHLVLLLNHCMESLYLF